jgi:hypothetical protein
MDRLLERQEVMAFFGLSGEAERAARSYIAAAVSAKRSVEDAIEDVLAIKREFGDWPITNPEGVFVFLDAKRDAQAGDIASQWYCRVVDDQVLEGKAEPRFDAFAIAPPTPAEVTQLRSRIDELRRTDPEAARSNLWQMIAIDIEEAAAPESAPMAHVAAADMVLGDPPTADRIEAVPNRKAEIESVMRGDYPRYARDRAMQSEYAQLVEREQMPFEIGTGDSAPAADVGNGGDGDGHS